MEALKTSIFIGLLFLTPVLYAQEDGRYLYIERYKFLAVTEMERTGIPASIKLAQGILESRWGTSDLATEANNHFGIKCGSKWQGAKVKKKDDDKDWMGRPIKSCFRSYSSAEESYIAHSEFLRDNKRYNDLFKLKKTDYKGWAKGLKKAGYATSNSYHKDLIRLIEELKLNTYDKMDTKELMEEGYYYVSPDKPKEKDKDRKKDKKEKEKEGPKKIVVPEILVNNDVKYVVSKAGESLSSVARRADVSVGSLLTYNEQLNDKNQILTAGEMVYIQPKRSSFRGRQKWHTVRSGEELLDISHTYGIDLRKLRERNALAIDEQPATGAKIKLRGRDVSRKPALRPGKRTRDLLSSNTQQPNITRPVVTPAPAATAVTTSANTHLSDPFGPKPATTGISSGSATAKPSTNGQLDFEMEPTQTGNASGSAIYHLVRSGETLQSLARAYGTTVEAIKKMNKLENDLIRRGERIRVE